MSILYYSITSSGHGMCAIHIIEFTVDNKNDDDDKEDNDDNHPKMTINTTVIP